MVELEIFTIFRSKLLHYQLASGRSFIVQSEAKFLQTFRLLSGLLDGVGIGSLEQSSESKVAV